jgi:hypothetical protein
MVEYWPLSFARTLEQENTPPTEIEDEDSDEDPDFPEPKSQVNDLPHEFDFEELDAVHEWFPQLDKGYKESALIPLFEKEAVPPRRAGSKASWFLRNPSSFPDLAEPASRPRKRQKR